MHSWKDALHTHYRWIIVAAGGVLGCVAIGGLFSLPVFLRPTKEGSRLRLRGGKISVTDGPFTETKEVIGGYAILEAKSMDEALELTKRFLKVHGDEWNVECEIRQLDGPEFGAEA